jgi:hypothetical protein
MISKNKKLFKIAVTILGIFALGALVWNWAYPSASYRFRMTVEVETPQGLRSGSGVMKVMSYRTLALTSEEKPGGGGLIGEAVVVDLPDGPLFVLLKLPEAKGDLGAVVTLALAPEARGGGIEAYTNAVKKLGGLFNRSHAELPREDWPMMVRFRNLNDPKSMQRIDLDAMGVERILLETTRDKMTVGIEKKFLGWLRLKISIIKERRMAKYFLFRQCHLGLA